MYTGQILHVWDASGTAAALKGYTIVVKNPDAHDINDAFKIFTVPKATR